ncbi:MAG: putative toxin-antitoxin system toxin component, PIN family [Burkholderiaceae bacterium]|jgi:putative PIN family toxin of toxin-antitoxin system
MTRLFIVDTNVLVAALITRHGDSPTARVLNAMIDGSLLFLLSPALLAEYRSVLLRPRLLATHRLTEAEIDELLATITANALWREPAAPPPQPAPDAGDAHLWALMASEPAAELITGDQLLLQRPYPGRVITSPRDHFGSA